MSQLLVVFDQSIKGPDGKIYYAQVWGDGVAKDRWEGWIEFQATDSDSSVRTLKETEQPNWADLKYWSEGLTEVYLQGALERALDNAMPEIPLGVLDSQQPAEEFRAEKVITARIHAAPTPPQQVRDNEDSNEEGE